MSRQTVRSGRRLGRGVAWNLLGYGAPLAVGVLAMPPLVAGLGVERFGLLAMAWVVVGYFSVFDLGLGRALTKLAAEWLATLEGDPARPQRMAALIWTALSAMAALGVAGALLLLPCGEWLVGAALNLPAPLRAEASAAFPLLVATVPLVILTTGLRGVLEGYHYFGLSNLLRVPTGLLLFLAPLAVLPFSDALPAAIAALLVARLIATAAHLAVVLWAVPETRLGFRFERAVLRRLAGFGGWMTVSNVVGPLMVYLDRFVIGAVATLAAVTFYVTPYEVVTRLLVIPAAVIGVLFPAFSAELASDRSRAARLYGRALDGVFLLLFPLTLGIAAFAPEGLALWLGGEFPQRSAGVVQWLALGVLLNGLANVPFALVQGAGRADLTARLHLLELPLYLPLLWTAVARWGIDGAAAAWTLRVAVDLLAMLALAGRVHREGAGEGRRAMVAALLAVLAWGALTSLESVGARGGLLLAALLAAAYHGRSILLDLLRGSGK
ncbi:flippase [Endothiovibrio diazotrophicus]